jgi:hypothetical protein
MSRSLKFLFGRFSLLLPLLLVLTLMASCSGTPLSLLTGGGPNVAANTQIGKTNNQTVGTTNNVSPTVNVEPDSNVGSIDQRTTTTKVASDKVETVIVNEVPVWVVLLLILGWLFPSPQEIARSVVNLFRRK